MTSFPRSAILISLVTLLLAVPLLAQSGRGGGRARSGPGTGNPTEDLPPWRFLESGIGTPASARLVLYWLPASLQEMNESPLLGSRALLDDSVRCVALEAIVPSNAAAVQQLSGGRSLPMAVLADSHGTILRSVSGSKGTLKLSQVEQMVRDELHARDEAMYRDITEAKRRADAGDRAAAVAVYQQIWDDRCLYPFAGQQAQSALKSLGVIVEEPPPSKPVDPNLPVKPPTVQTPAEHRGHHEH